MLFRSLLTLSLIAHAPMAMATQGALTEAEAITLALTESREWCAAEGGTLRPPEHPATAVDLTGDGTSDDWIISEAGAFCGPDLGYLGGSGGAMLHAVIGSTVQSWLGGAWILQDIAFTVEGELNDPVRMLLLGLHGSQCDSFGAAPCLLALSWDGERLIHFIPYDPEDAGEESN